MFNIVSLNYSMEITESIGWIALGFLPNLNLWSSLGNLERSGILQTQQH